jgi:hypothetical protein
MVAYITIGILVTTVAVLWAKYNNAVDQVHVQKLDILRLEHDVEWAELSVERWRNRVDIEIKLRKEIESLVKPNQPS